MEELQDALCKLLRELTSYHCDNLQELRSGFLLSNILNAIDERHFPSPSASVDWNKTRHLLEKYLTHKGLQNPMLEFDSNEIAQGAITPLVTSLLQVITILAVINPSRWESALKAIDSESRSTLAQVIDPLIDDFKAEIDLAQRSLTSQNERNGDIKHMLQQLEKYEQNLQIAEKKLNESESKRKQEQKEIRELKRLLDSKDRELMDVRQLKDDLVTQFESSLYQRSKTLDKEHLTKINKLSFELEDLNKRLFQARDLVSQKEGELEKKELQISILEQKLRESEELEAQMMHYKRLAENLKREKELTETKLKVLEQADKSIMELKSQLKEEQEKIAVLRAENQTMKSKNEGLSKRLLYANEKVSLIKKQSFANLENHSLMAFQTLFKIDGGESKTDRAADKKNAKGPSKENCYDFDESDRFKEAKLKLSEEPLDLEGSNFLDEIRALQNALPRYSQQLRSMASIEIGKDTIPNSLKPSDKRKMQQLVTDELDESNEGDNKSLLYGKENMQILYSVIMEFAHFDMVKRRAIAGDHTDRARDILRPFAISNFITIGSKAFN